MLNWWQAMLLGIIQGLTEFLPVSSSGHLVLAQNLMGVQGDMLMFDTLLHGATLLAVAAVYWRDLWEMIKKPWAKLPLLLILATIPAVLAGFLLQDVVEAAFAGGVWLGVGFLLTGIVLIAVEAISVGLHTRSGHTNIAARNHTTVRNRTRAVERGRSIEQLEWRDALLIGLAQAVAIFPGLSRSGSTISAGLATGLRRSTAARFAFLMSVPVILGSIVLQATKIDGTMEVAIFPMILGVLCAAISGYLAIRFMLTVLQKGNMRGFAIYVLLLGAWVVLDSLALHWVF